MGVKIKFPKVSRDSRETFSHALSLYKKGSFSECYSLISSLAKQNTPRAIYCKALLDINDNIPEAEGSEAFIKGLKKAIELKYPLALGAFATFCFDSDETEKLASFCIKNKKIVEPRLLAMLAATYDGFYENAKPFESLKLAQKTYAFAINVFENAVKKPTEEWEENDAYVGAGGWTLSLSYAFLNRLLMLSYRYLNIYQNRNLYREAYAKAAKYADNELFRFGLKRIHAETLMRDLMGLSDLKAVNSAMQELENAYVKLPAEQQEAQEENYENIWAEYKEYFENESARLRSLNIHANENFQETFKGRGVGDMLVELAHGVERWANTPNPTTHTYYEINGKRFDKDDQGYLYDEQGIRGDYRIDDVGRVYDEYNNELGYFSTDGIFMPKR